VNNQLLKDRCIVIIGGTSGLGLSAASHFMSEGANVLVVGRNQDTAGEAAQALGKKASVLVGDATLSQTAIEAVELCQREFGNFDGLYHVAGGSGRSFGDGPLHELTPEGWNKTMELNLTSLMLSNQAAVRKFMELGRPGTILNMGSVLGYSPSPRYFTTHAYAAAKAAIIGFTKSIAAYYAPYNIRVNVIAPALVETPMAKRAAGDEKILDFIKTKQPLAGGRIGNPKDLDGLAAYFMSDQSSFTTGQVIAVDGGWSVSEGQY
jgi:NAD(P)-dependent dehydrogenase (short-subunit alcohol dehydrogenase family)